jgi:hypothetical protein
MFHSSFMTISTCFIHTLYHFDAFSGTNLLTRCRSASSYFLLFLVSEILHRKYSRNWTKQKPNLLFFRGTHGARRASQGEAHDLHTIGWRGQEGGRRHMGWAPQAPLAPPFRLYIPSVAKTLKRSVIFHEKLRSRRHREAKFGGQKSLFRHAAETGKCPRNPSPSTPSPSPSPLLSPMMRRE